MVGKESALTQPLRDLLMGILLLIFAIAFFERKLQIPRSIISSVQLGAKVFKRNAFFDNPGLKSKPMKTMYQLDGHAMVDI